MTPRERQVADLLLTGASNRDIAKELKISPRTVKAHLYHLRLRYQARNRVKLAIVLYRERQEA